jgi:hypothetical protein
LRGELDGQRRQRVRLYHRRAVARQRGFRRLLQCAVHRSIGPQHRLPLFQQPGWASLDTVETYYPPLVSCPSDISNIVGRAENAVGGKYVQLGELPLGSAVELTGTIITPFGAHRGRLGINPFENALFLWEGAQQHACTTYQALLQTPFMVTAVGKVKQVLAALEK